MASWPLVVCILQVVAICLGGQGGIILNLAGFEGEKIATARKCLAKRMKGLATITFVLTVVVGTIVWQFTMVPRFEGPDKERASVAFTKCLEDARLARRLDPRYSDPEAEAWASRGDVSICKNVAMRGHDVKIAYDSLLPISLRNDSRLIGAFIAVVFIIPLLVANSVGMRKLGDPDAKLAIIVRSCTMIYAAVAIQVFLEVISLFERYAA